jgi:FtsZ-binding cell division protein ZapB
MDCEHKLKVLEQEIESLKEENRLLKEKLSSWRKNRHKAQRKAKFYINKCRSASCMQGGLKQASA